MRSLMTPPNAPPSATKRDKGTSHNKTRQIAPSSGRSHWYSCTAVSPIGHITFFWSLSPRLSLAHWHLGWSDAATSNPLRNLPRSTSHSRRKVLMFLSHAVHCRHIFPDPDARGGHKGLQPISGPDPRACLRPRSHSIRYSDAPVARPSFAQRPLSAAFPHERPLLPFPHTSRLTAQVPRNTYLRNIKSQLTSGS